MVVAEDAAGSTDLGAHVADRGLTGGGDAVGSGPDVLDDGTRAALDRQHTSDLQDDILRRRPSAERAGELDADHLRPTNVEREAGHDVDRIGTTDADRDHAQPACVGRVAIGADHHPTGEGVVLQHDLVNDATAGTPETDAVLGADGSQEVVHLSVGVDRDAEVDEGTDLRGDQVVAVHRAGYGRGGEAGRHELQQRHLCRRVLHGDSIGMKVVVGAAALDGRGWIAEVVQQDLLGQRQRSPESLATGGAPGNQCVVHALDQFDWCACGDRHGCSFTRVTRLFSYASHKPVPCFSYPM